MTAACLLISLAVSSCGSSQSKTPAAHVAVATPTIVITPTPTATPTPTPAATPTPTPVPVVTAVPTPAQPPPAPARNLCGAPPNPWAYNFCGGNLTYSPPSNFCSYFNCIPSFWKSTNGYVDECSDGTYSHSGGQRGACSYHGGEMRPLYGP